MTATEFKKAISEIKEVLKGKVLNIHFQNGNKVEKLTFSSLREFGNAILDLEKKGAGFNFMKAGNRFVQKGIYSPSQAPEVLTRGVWDEIYFLATTVK